MAPLVLFIGAFALELATLAAAVPEEATCSAKGGKGCADPPGFIDRHLKCVKWRQTGGCNPKGPRERHGDKNCNEEIPTGSSGYCQCGTESDKIRVRESTCDHRPFKCSTECLQVRRYMCVSWRQTGQCSSDGTREPAKDKPCDTIIDATMSGFCECGEGRIVRKPGCQHGEFEEPFTCRDECAAEPGLYEELDLDQGATEKDVKQAFRKMSLKYHPDKTRNDPALTARFTSIREAYDILGDATQRGIYDAAGLKMVYEARGQKIEQGPASNGDFPITLEGMYNGHEAYTTVKRKVICRGCAENRNTPRCRKCSLQCANEVQLVNVRMGPMVMQQKQQVPSKEKCRNTNTQLFVSVERGANSGDTVVFKAMGEQQPKKMPGDVVLTLREQKHKLFERRGIDLHTEIEISLKEALLGFERALLHLDGRKIVIGHSGVTRPFGVMKIEGEGMPLRGDPTQHGSLFVKCRIVMPNDGPRWLRENAPSR